MIKSLRVSAILFFAFLCSVVTAQNFNLTLEAVKSYGSEKLSNIWGYVDKQGNEYALVGAANGLSVVNVTNPKSPVEVKKITGPGPCTWREVKTIGDYAYVTTECGSVGLQIVDLSGLPGNTNLPVATWAPTISGKKLATIHALDVEGTRLYLYGTNIGNGGALICDVASNPMQPTYLGKYDTKYVHDGEVRGNTAYFGHIMDGYFSIVDVTNPASPVLQATQITPTAFTHNTWTSTDWKYLFTTDENSNSFLAAYDITNVGNIKEVDRVQVTPGSGSIIHNTYTINKGGNDYSVVSWYKDGVVIVDCGNPANMVVVGWYDHYAKSGNGFEGTWGVYPYLPSGIILASNIEDGLYIYTPNYVRACYLEGTITDAITGNPINAADVSIQTTLVQENSNSAGFYATGYGNSGTYNVVYSKSGYVPQTVSVTLNHGVVTVQNVQLVPMTPFSVTGRVANSWNNVGVPSAHVRLVSSSNTFDTITDANGFYTIPNFYGGTYEITAGKWGYINKCTSNVYVMPNPGLPTMLIDSGIYDEFTWNFGWVRTGNATDGLWVRGEPVGTQVQNPGDCNPEYDVNNDCTNECYVTGNGGGNSGDDDVDGGATIITSPTFDLRYYANPRLDYYRWFYNGGGNGGPNDSLRVYITNGTQTVMLENVQGNDPNKSKWYYRQFYLKGVIPFTATMKIIVRAVDYGNGNIVEGGIDKVRILDSLMTNVSEQQTGSIVAAYPNPFVESITLEYSLFGSLKANAKAVVTDLTGREVMFIPVDSNYGSFTLNAALNEGVYFVRIINGDEITPTYKIVKIK